MKALLNAVDGIVRCRIIQPVTKSWLGKVFDVLCADEREALYQPLHDVVAYAADAHG